MDGLIYRELTIEECDCIKDINASQYIRRAWREVEGVRKLTEINYHDKDWPNGYEEHYNSLKKTINNGGIAIGSFDEHNTLVGFVTVNRDIFGRRFKYVLLDQLYITLEHRGKGIGKKLFMLSVEAAKEWEVDRIYICAGSAEETIGFYHSIGCRVAEEINPDLYNSDPRDLQMEFVL